MTSAGLQEQYLNIGYIDDNMLVQVETRINIKKS